MIADHTHKQNFQISSSLGKETTQIEVGHTNSQMACANFQIDGVIAKGKNVL